MTKIINLSVHQLVDFLLRKGDIDNRIFNNASMAEGTKLHAMYQRSKNDDYISEYYLKQSFFVEGVEIILEGRADGVFTLLNKYVIEEIKTTVDELESFYNKNSEWHLGQAKCYGLMLIMEKGLEEVDIRLTYIKQNHLKEQIHKNYHYSKEELEQFVYPLLEEYISFNNILTNQIAIRDNSISNLTFPYKSYRKGQKIFSKYVFSSIKNGATFFVEAPTGIGKTMSSLYPAIKSLLDDEKSKIFYLTAKSSGKENAEKALNILIDKGLFIKYIVITAKEKICFCKGKSCNPDECIYTKDYYSKINQIIKIVLLENMAFNQEMIINIANKYGVCPFELELDLSLFCDVIICDFNYVFDPIAYMKRYFDEDSSHYICLIDEAHNLIDRSREMYSSSLSSDQFEKALKSIKKIKQPKLKRRLNNILNLFINETTKFEKGLTEIPDFNFEIFKKFESLNEFLREESKNNKSGYTKEIKDLSFDINRFLLISDIVDENVTKYVEIKDYPKLTISYNIFCYNPSIFLKRCFTRLKSSIFFSATLSPIDYYIDVLGGDKSNDPHLSLPSPFPRNNFKILLAPKVSIKYKDRDSSYEIVWEYISSYVRTKVGNYFIYCPSYEYMNNLLDKGNISDCDIFVQEKEMNDNQRIDFLGKFKENPKKTTIGFLVLGGAFGEGIDLVADRLIGVVIIGVGLPKINFKSDKISQYYDSLELKGRKYAYVYPGMNKVMQAVGRVIRSENDKGSALLIDDRYTQHQYLSLFKSEWQNYEVCLNPDDVYKTLLKFYKN